MCACIAERLENFETRGGSEQNAMHAGLMQTRSRERPKESGIANRLLLGRVAPRGSEARRFLGKSWRPRVAMNLRVIRHASAKRLVHAGCATKRMSQCPNENGSVGLQSNSEAASVWRCWRAGHKLRSILQCLLILCSVEECDHRVDSKNVRAAIEKLRLVYDPRNGNSPRHERSLLRFQRVGQRAAVQLRHCEPENISRGKRSTQHRLPN